MSDTLTNLAPLIDAYPFISSLTDSSEEVISDNYENISYSMDINEKLLRLFNNYTFKELNKINVTKTLNSIYEANLIEHNNYYEIKNLIIGDYMKSNYEKLIIERIHYEDSSILFFKPVHIDIENKDDCYIAIMPVLDITTIEDTSDAALNSLYDEILFLWEDYALEDDKKMTLDAIELKQRILNVIKEVY